jgi:hypothetical protein
MPFPELSVSRLAIHIKASWTCPLKSKDSATLTPSTGTIVMSHSLSLPIDPHKYDIHSPSDEVEADVLML